MESESREVATATVTVQETIGVTIKLVAARLPWRTEREQSKAKICAKQNAQEKRERGKQA